MSEKLSGASPKELGGPPRHKEAIPVPFRSVLMARRQAYDGTDILRNAKLRSIKGRIYNGAYTIDSCRVAEALLEESPSGRSV